jgi:hypothetical protein
MIPSQPIGQYIGPCHAILGEGSSKIATTPHSCRQSRVISCWYASEKCLTNELEQQYSATTPTRACLILVSRAVLHGTLSSGIENHERYSKAHDSKERDIMLYLSSSTRDSSTYVVITLFIGQGSLRNEGFGTCPGHSWDMEQHNDPG